MAAPTLETNAAADTLRIMDGNSGDPTTWNDVWDWDDGGGSSGGDGDVPKDGGGTAKVNTFVTETVADAVYLVLKNVDFGDAVAPTYFTSRNEFIYFTDDHVFSIKNNATLEQGKLVNSWGVDGSDWSVKPDANSSIIASDGTGIHHIYASRLHVRNNSKYLKWESGTIEIRNSILSRSGNAQWYDYFYFDPSVNVSFNNVYVYGGYTGLIFEISPSEFDYVHMHHQATFGLYFNYVADVTLPNIKMTDVMIDIKTNKSADVKIVNPLQHLSTLEITTAGNTVKEQYTCNIHMADKNGANLAGVTVDCEDQFGTAVWAVGTITTDAAGDIAEQIITYKKWEGTSETLTTYSPHKFTISKAGYETMVLDAVTVDGKVDWHLELLDELAEGDVRDGVAYGEDSEGNLELPAAGDVEDGVGFGSNGVEFTGDFEVPPEADVRDGEGYGAGGAEFEGDLDLPAIGDVEKGVQFDSLTKTGTFKAPAETDVRDGEGYGEDDTEFTGTLDLPAEADVEDGVVFDGATKEGNFEAPAEADVEDGIGYGAGGVEFEGDLELPAEEDVEVGVGYGSLGTEFEGTYLGLRGNNLTAVLEKSVALTGHLEKKVSLTGELKS